MVTGVIRCRREGQSERVWEKQLELKAIEGGGQVKCSENVIKHMKVTLAKIFW